MPHVYTDAHGMHNLWPWCFCIIFYFKKNYQILVEAIIERFTNTIHYLLFEVKKFHVFADYFATMEAFWRILAHEYYESL